MKNHLDEYDMKMMIVTNIYYPDRFLLCISDFLCFLLSHNVICIIIACSDFL